MKILWTTLTGAALLVSCLGARAALGDTQASVENDRAQFGARMASRVQSAFTVQTLTSASGQVIKEYVSNDGVVFAVSWLGAGHPNMQQLLGTHFQRFQGLVAGRYGAAGRAPLTASDEVLVVHSAGHARAFTGLAYLPQFMPATVTPSDLN